MTIRKKRPIGKRWNETDFRQAQKIYSFGFQETAMIIYWDIICQYPIRLSTRQRRWMIINRELEWKHANFLHDLGFRETRTLLYPNWYPWTSLMGYIESCDEELFWTKNNGN